MRKRSQRLICLALALFLCSGRSLSSSNPVSKPQLSTDFSPKENSFTFCALSSDKLCLSEDSAATVLAAVAQVQPDYEYASFYQLDEVKKRLAFAVSVEVHCFSALDANGTLNSEHLAALIKSNNDAFLATDPFGYKPVEDGYISDICSFIVTIIELMQEKYPAIDWTRVYCNLGNLKILYNIGMLSFAEVSSDMILSLSQNNTEIVLALKGEDGFTRVLTHEIMHIIQIGCTCENIENVGRRAGISVYWDDFSLNTTDWTWMVEGSAERHMCALTGGEAVSYQYKMDYLCSMTMSVLLRDSVNADTMETLCFYDNPQLLFDAFGCETQQQQDELLKMMITLQVLQIGPKNFHITYTEETGIDLLADEETANQFYYSLKPAICITLAKEFYENLVPFLQENPVSSDDLFFLINLFEGHLNQHLSFASESRAQINQPFITAYTSMRDALFVALAQNNPGLDVSSAYENYQITEAGTDLLNAELSMLPAQKLAFLAERAQWQAESFGLGVKVPQ